MRMGIIGKKVGMTRIFGEDGSAIPVTVIDASDCVVTQVKLKEKDGYAGLQVAFGERKPQNVTKAIKGHLKNAGVANKAKFGEIRVQSDDEIAHLKPGQVLKSDMFAIGDRIDVTGFSKGKGFAGVMKRHNFHGAKATHGVHEAFRHGGSIGTCTFPGRVIKNVGMPGQLGNTQVTTQNLEIVEIHPKENLILIRGAVPGSKEGYICIRSAVKKETPSDRTWA